MIVVDVDPGDRAYPIHVGSELLSKAELFVPHIRGARAMIVTSETVMPLYVTKVEAAIHSLGKAVDTVVLPDGESFKKWDTLNRIFDTLLTAGADHETMLIVLGGGVVGDMTGFAAACYVRGVPSIQVPTTLLSQVDSLVGGKTNINHPLGKNMIGASHQPQAALADIDTLRTLLARELATSMAEVIKHDAITDADYFAWVEQNIRGLNNCDTGLMTEAVRGSVRIRAAVMAQDEREAGLRAALNFGHTFDHTVEAGLGYGEWLHGEAVDCGMVVAANLSHRLGFIDIDTHNRIAALTYTASLPAVAPDLDVNRFIGLMHVGKKAEAGEIKFVLPHKLGQAFVTAVPDADLRAILQHVVLRPPTEAPIA